MRPTATGVDTKLTWPMNAYRETSLQRHRRLRSFSYALRRFPIDLVRYETRVGLAALVMVVAVYRMVDDSDGSCWCPWRPRRSTAELDVSMQQSRLTRMHIDQLERTLFDAGVC